MFVDIANVKHQELNIRNGAGVSIGLQAQLGRFVRLVDLQPNF